MGRANMVLGVKVLADCLVHLLILMSWRCFSLLTNHGSNPHSPPLYNADKQLLSIPRTYSQQVTLLLKLSFKWMLKKFSLYSCTAVVNYSKRTLLCSDMFVTSIIEKVTFYFFLSRVHSSILIILKIHFMYIFDYMYCFCSQSYLSLFFRKIMILCAFVYCVYFILKLHKQCIKRDVLRCVSLWQAVAVH